MISRRQWVLSAAVPGWARAATPKKLARTTEAARGAAAAGFSNALVAAGGPVRANARPGCQTNAWRIAPGDFEAFLKVLDRVRHHGYRGFETGFRNIQGQFQKPRAARRRIEKTGLEFLGVHIFLLDYDYEPATALAPFDLIEGVAEGGAALGARRLILSGRGLSREGAPDADALARKARGLERAARVCLNHNLTLCYHNHDVEFMREAVEMEELLKRTDRDLVRLMVDAGHARRAGADVSSFFERHRGRIEGFHLRDYRGGQQVPFGQGEFDPRGLAEGMRRHNWKGWVVSEEERDNDGRPGDEAVEPARRGMREVFGV